MSYYCITWLNNILAHIHQQTTNMLRNLNINILNNTPRTAHNEAKETNLLHQPTEFLIPRDDELGEDEIKKEEIHEDSDDLDDDDDEYPCGPEEFRMSYLPAEGH